MKKTTFAALFFLAAAPLLLFQETEDVIKNNQKLLRGGEKREAGKLGSWEVEKTGRVEGEKERSSKMRLKASIPLLQTNSNDLYNIRHFDEFAADSIHLKKPSGGPKGLIGPPCHGVYIALGVSYHIKDDQYFKQVYDNGTANYTVEAGYWLMRSLAVGIKLSYLHKTGKTLLLRSETSLWQIPVMGYLKLGFRLARRWRVYGALDFGYLFFKEESYIGAIEDSQPGWGLESGLEYSFTKTLYLLGAVGFQSFKKTFPGLNETQQLGGVDIRIGIGIKVF
jgi:hypothetical protein